MKTAHELAMERLGDCASREADGCPKTSCAKLEANAPPRSPSASCSPKAGSPGRLIKATPRPRSSWKTTGQRPQNAPGRVRGEERVQPPGKPACSADKPRRSRSGDGQDPRKLVLPARSRAATGRSNAARPTHGECRMRPAATNRGRSAMGTRRVIKSLLVELHPVPAAAILHQHRKAKMLLMMAGFEKPGPAGAGARIS